MYMCMCTCTCTCICICICICKYTCTCECCICICTCTCTYMYNIGCGRRAQWMNLLSFGQPRSGHRGVIILTLPCTLCLHRLRRSGAVAPRRGRDRCNTGRFRCAYRANAVRGPLCQQHLSSGPGSVNERGRTVPGAAEALFFLASFFFAPPPAPSASSPSPFLSFFDAFLLASSSSALPRLFFGLGFLPDVAALLSSPSSLSAPPPLPFPFRPPPFLDCASPSSPPTDSGGGTDRLPPPPPPPSARETAADRLETSTPVPAPPPP